MFPIISCLACLNLVKRPDRAKRSGGLLALPGFSSPLLCSLSPPDRIAPRLFIWKVDILNVRPFLSSLPCMYTLFTLLFQPVLPSSHLTCFTHFLFTIHACTIPPTTAPTLFTTSRVRQVDLYTTPSGKLILPLYTPTSPTGKARHQQRPFKRKVEEKQDPQTLSCHWLRRSACGVGDATCNTLRHSCD